MKKNKIFKAKVLVSFFLVSGLMFSSCKKYLGIPVPEDQVVSSTVFANDNAAKSAIDGLYSYMMTSSNTVASGGVTLFCGLSADELDNTISLPASDDQFHENSLLADNIAVQNNLWFFGFTIVYRCNVILEGLNKSTKISPNLRLRLKAEATFVRAFSLFTLTNLFGDVPVPVTANYVTNSKLTRTPVSEVNAQVIKDLLECIELFEQSNTQGQTGYPSSWSARALLARVYLYSNNWMKADEMASTVINSGQFSLVNELSNVFTVDSPEGIWQMWPVSPGMNTWEAAFLVPSNTESIPRYVITDALENSFEPGDLRKQSWTAVNTVGGEEYRYSFKYKQVYSDPIVENYFVLRLSEQYLIRAEARTNLGNFADACEDLNLIRSRAGLPSLSINSSNDLLDAVLHEKQTELFCEWGHRWFDLKRSDKGSSILSNAKSNWKSTDFLYPIPLEEIKTNPALTQNEGY